MSREMLKNIIDYLPEKEIENVYNMVIRLVPEEEALPDEVKAIEMAEGEADIVMHDMIDWS